MCVVHHVGAWCLPGLDEGGGSLGTAVTDDCEPLWENRVRDYIRDRQRRPFPWNDLDHCEEIQREQINVQGDLVSDVWVHSGVWVLDKGKRRF